MTKTIAAESLTSGGSFLPVEVRPISGSGETDDTSMEHRALQTLGSVVDSLGTLTIDYMLPSMSSVLPGVPKGWDQRLAAYHPSSYLFDSGALLLAPAEKSLLSAAPSANFGSPNASGPVLTTESDDALLAQRTINLLEGTLTARLEHLDHNDNEQVSRMRDVLQILSVFATPVLVASLKGLVRNEQLSADDLRILLEALLTLEDASTENEVKEIVFEQLVTSAAASRRAIAATALGATKLTEQDRTRMKEWLQIEPNRTVRAYLRSAIG